MEEHEVPPDLRRRRGGPSHRLWTRKRVLARASLRGNRRSRHWLVHFHYANAKLALKGESLLQSVENGVERRHFPEP